MPAGWLWSSDVAPVNLIVLKRLLAGTVDGPVLGPARPGSGLGLVIELEADVVRSSLRAKDGRGRGHVPAGRGDRWRMRR